MRSRFGHEGALMLRVHARMQRELLLLPRHRQFETLLGRDEMVVVVAADIDLHPVNLAGERITRRTIVGRRR